MTFLTLQNYVNGEQTRGCQGRAGGREVGTMKGLGGEGTARCPDCQVSYWGCATAMSSLGKLPQVQGPLCDCLELLVNIQW